MATRTRRTGSKLAVVKYVVRCVRREEPPRISEFAQQLELSPAHLSRAFRSEYGITLSDYMKAQQVRCAARLLRETDLSATRIAYTCGFGTRRTLFRAFRQRMGLSPDEYRRLWWNDAPARLAEGIK
jgi:AraC-like DNA-binding protein